MQIIRLITAIALFALTSTATAQTVSAKGIGNVSLNGELTSEVRSEAVREASINALDRYFAESNQMNAKNYDLIRDDMVAEIEKFVLSVAVLSEDIDGQSIDTMRDATSGLYTVVVRADINTNRVNNELTSQSVIANTADRDKSLLTFVFVARQQASVQSFDDKVYARTDVQAKMDASANIQNRITESENITANSVSLNDSQNVDASANLNSTVAVTSGGSTTTKADVIQWDVTRASEINSVMIEVFTNAGYEVVEAEYLEEESGGLINLADVRADYGTGNDLSSETKRNITTGVRNLDIPYVALGTLDVGMKSTDPASGLTQVHVTVAAKVLDVSGRFPRTASSVAPVQFAGLGKDETVARTNALNLAAEAAAKQLTDQLNARSFQ
jgi:hypothetical protein